MRRYFELVRPTATRVRTAAVQAGLGSAHFDAWLDTGYEGSDFEYSFSVGIGPWSYRFCWYR